MPPAALSRLIGRADAPLVLDVRPPARFATSDRLLPGARRCAPDDVPHFASQETPRAVLVYCVYGHGVGRRAAETLRSAGWARAAWTAASKAARTAWTPRRTSRAGAPCR